MCIAEGALNGNESKAGSWSPWGRVDEGTSRAGVDCSLGFRVWGLG
jgi:hypothetical protein